MKDEVFLALRYDQIKQEVPPTPDETILKDVGASKIDWIIRNEIYKDIIVQEFEGEEITKASRGYLFFPTFSPRNINGIDYTRPLGYLLPREYGMARFSEEPSIEDMIDMADILALDYKIHLMPKPEYKPMVLRRLAEAIKADPVLKEAIADVKVLVVDTYADSSGFQQPEVVIYPNLGKASAIKALLCLRQLFDDCDDVIGSGKIPRCNVALPGSNTIYYSQGAFDFKAAYYTYRRNIFRNDSSIPDFTEDYSRFTRDKGLEEFMATGEIPDDREEIIKAESAAINIMTRRIVKSDTFLLLKSIIQEPDDGYLFRPPEEVIPSSVECFMATTGFSKVMVLKILEDAGLTISEQYLSLIETPDK